MVIPFIMLMSPGGFQPKRVFKAAVLSIIGIFVMRLDLVAAGQLVPHQYIYGTEEIVYNSYSISWAERGILFGAIGATILLYLGGEKK
ncbi:hypothetical protein [Tepidibacillus marianensis]|uniref:hypothetical protein n=1 Tax=Tepidibacillus marianensis TaxID=3131995 RepID=UPI0030D08232